MEIKGGKDKFLASVKVTSNFENEKFFTLQNALS